MCGRVRGDGGGGSAARTLELVVEGVEKNPSIVGRGCRSRESVPRTADYVLSYGSLARDCATGANPGRHQPSYGSLCPYASRPLFATLAPSPFRCLSRSTFLSFSLSLSAPPLYTPSRQLYPHQNAECDNPSLFSLHPFGVPPFFANGVVLHRSFSLSLSLQTSVFLLTLPDAPSILSSSLFPRIPSTYFLFSVSLYLLRSRGASLRHLFPREQFHPPRRDRQSSRSDAFDHSRGGYPIVHPPFSRSYGIFLPLFLPLLQPLAFPHPLSISVPLARVQPPSAHTPRAKSPPTQTDA